MVVFMISCPDVINMYTYKVDLYLCFSNVKFVHSVMGFKQVVQVLLFICFNNEINGLLTR